MIYPGSLVETPDTLNVYRLYRPAAGDVLQEKFATAQGPFLVIAVMPEAFSNLSGIYISYVICSAGCGWVYLNTEYGIHNT